jgi:peptidoglycan/LPS O-acetylase OafA/YrhL
MMLLRRPRPFGDTAGPPVARLFPMTAARSTGLDTLRALAIALVFVYHYRIFVSGTPSFGWLSEVGWVGVDLFFVLSGYLIGHQLFAGLAAGRRLSLPGFYARRALRTWPAFWVVLAAYFLWPAEMGGRTPPPLWRFLTFTQNFGLPPGTAFSHAWSLCIEEQFYLVLPLSALAFVAAGRRPRTAWLAFGALLAIGIAARSLLWFEHGRELAGGGTGTQGYHPHIYYATLCRFDEFLPGLAIALLRNFHPIAWTRLMDHGRALFWSGVAALALVLAAIVRWYYVDDVGYTFALTAFGYSAVAWAFALLVASALSPASPLQRWRIPGAPQLALWSYSIYLTHKAVAHVLHQLGRQQGWSPGFQLAVITLASIAVGALLYRLVERPFMDLRDRWCPSLFRAPAVPGAPVRAPLSQPASRPD